jgi:hypothetical protein
LAIEDEIVAEARRRALADVRLRFRAGQETIRGGAAPSFRPASRPGADLADEIVEAYEKARRQAGEDVEPDNDDDDDPDREGRVRGPEQRPLVATPDAILRAARKAGFL